MIDLVRKRHDGDGWLVFQELGDKPGYYRNRSADAVALGVWASTKYEAHLYEFKISREDVKRELRDPTKAEGVGKYCTYWWLVVDDEKRIEDLVIPEAWGILKVRIDKVAGKEIRRLAVVRKAPRLKPKAIDVHFSVSMIRNMAKHWKSPIEFERMQAERDAALDARNLPPAPDVAELEEKLRRAERELKDMREGIERFEKESGVAIGKGAHPFEYARIGTAVKVALDMRDRIKTETIREDIAYLSTAANELERRAFQLAESAVALRGLAAFNGCGPRCRSNSSWGRGQCNCGATPLSDVERKLATNASLLSASSSVTVGPPTSCPSVATIGVHAGDPCSACGVLSASVNGAAPPATWAWKDDDEGGGVDRGGAGAPEQDAGVQLRDQRAEVPHGE